MFAYCSPVSRHDPCGWGEHPGTSIPFTYGRGFVGSHAGRFRVSGSLVELGLKKEEIVPYGQLAVLPSTDERRGFEAFAGWSFGAVKDSSCLA